MLYSQTEEALPLEGVDGYAAEIGVLRGVLPDGASARALPARESMNAVELMRALLASREQEREEDRMFEPGVMFWAERDNLAVVRTLGVRYGQLGIPGGMELIALVGARNGRRRWRRPA